MARFIQIPIPQDDNYYDFYQDWIKATKKIIEKPSIIVDGRYDPNMTFEEAMKKGIIPPNSAGLKPSWKEKTREKYRACISPSLETYKLAVEKINLNALQKYDDQTKSYIKNSFGISGVNSLFSAFLSDASVKVSIMNPKNWTGS